MKYSDRILVNQTGQNISMFDSAFYKYPEEKKLPEDIADIFHVRLFDSKQTGKLHIIVNFLDD